MSGLLEGDNQQFEWEVQGYGQRVLRTEGDQWLDL